jgi:hypothetical protein
VITRQKDFRNLVAFPRVWLGVLGMFEEAVGKTFLGSRLEFAHDAGEQADDGIEEDEGRRFAA